MLPDFYERAGSLLSPGDIFDRLPYIRVPNPIRVARKVAFSPTKRAQIQGELREILEVGKHQPNPPFNFDPPGEEMLANGRMAKAIFLTWGSEVEQDERHGHLHKKDWLIAPVFSMVGIRADDANAIRSAQSPRFFPLSSLPTETVSEYYVDFRRICPLSATHFQGLPRAWRLSRVALNAFYHQLLWFFTRKKIFFQPIPCTKCGHPVDLGTVFERQPINPEQELP